MPNAWTGIAIALSLLLAPFSEANAAGDLVQPDTVRVSNWIVAGPLSIGSREALVDPLWPADPAELEPAAGDSLPSLMAPGGWVYWLPVAGKGEVVTFAYEGIDWDGLAGQWGSAGTLCAGFAFGNFVTGRAASYWIDASGIGSLYLDGRRYLGNPYGGGGFKTPIRLDGGHHRVLLRVSGGGPREVRFQLSPAEGPLGLCDSDVTLPDLVSGEPLDGWGAAPVVNLTGKEVRGAFLSFGDGRLIEKVRVPIPPLEPEGMLKVPFPLRTLRTPAAGERWRGEIRLAIGDGDLREPSASPSSGAAGRTAKTVESAFSCSLRVRDPRASRLVTFLSALDGSVQKYAVLPPSRGGSVSGAVGSSTRGADVAKDRFALILSLHGAGVEPLPQVDSYAPKDWAYVVAPTNRRPFGFDWQDWGRMSAIESLDDAFRRYPIDPDRVVLTGHSMGGHGTWHVGLAHADRFAALAPSAGWASFGTYMPFTLRRDAAAADQPMRAIWERAMAPDNPLSFIRNARGMPVFVLHGEKDDNVPVFHGRLLAQRAREDGARVTYREIPGMNHWWDRPETPGVDCVDDPEMMAFLKAARRDARPDSVFLCTVDLGTCDRSGWIVVDEALHPFARSEVEAHILKPPERGFAIRTSGVREITCDPAGLFTPGPLRIAIDSDRLWAAAGEPVHLRLVGRHWRLSKRVSAGHPRSGGPPASLSDGRAVWGRGTSGRFRGPLKAAFFEPFVLVYGTHGTPQETEAMRRLAVLDSQNWYLRADGYAPVLPDTSITREIASTRTLILYAVPGANAILESLASRLPIRFDPAGVTAGRKRYGGDGLAVRFVCANPGCPDRLVEVVAGTDLAGLELSAAANPCYSGSGYPDFVVFDASVRRNGWGGMLAAGFFTAQGRIARNGTDAYFR